MKNLLIGFLIFIPFLLSAQSNYHKGSVTTNGDQTLTGYINYREWEENPKVIDFKENLDDSRVKSFYPSAIKAFVIDGFEKYFTYSGKISMNATRFPKLAEGKDTTTKNEVVFLKLVSTGLNLYLLSYTDSLKTRYFVQEQQNQPLELSYQEYYSGSQSQVETERRYRGQLIYYSNKYAPSDTKLVRLIEHSRYDGSDIESIVAAINGNQSKAVTSRASYTRFFVGAGINSSRTGLSGNNYWSKGAQADTYTPQLNLGIDIFNNPNVQRFALRLQLSGSYANPNFQFQETLSSSGVTYSLTQINITLIPQLIWNIYNKDAFKFYVDGGVAFNYSIYPTNKITTNGISQGKPYDLVNFWSNFPLQVGIVLNKKIELFATYTGATAFTRYVDFSISTETYSGGIRYLFGHKTK